MSSVTRDVGLLYKREKKKDKLKKNQHLFSKKKKKKKNPNRGGPRKHMTYIDGNFPSLYPQNKHSFS